MFSCSIIQFEGENKMCFHTCRPFVCISNTQRVCAPERERERERVRERECVCERLIKCLQFNLGTNYADQNLIN